MSTVTSSPPTTPDGTPGAALHPRLRVDRTRHGVIDRDGADWVVAVDGHEVHVPDLVGMRYLAELLTHPGEQIPSLALASGGHITRLPSQQELLDDQARAAYGERAEELTAALNEAEANMDTARAERLRTEIDLLVDEIEAATGLAGRDRTFNDDAERARTAVRKAIKRALDAIDDTSPTIGAILRSCITTGVTCSYIPRRLRPVTWTRLADASAGTERHA
jgi:hypothetical protein